MSSEANFQESVKLTDGFDDQLERICCAVRTLLECIGEDPTREGLLATPLRFSKSLLSLTSGRSETVESIVNNALFNESHNEMVIVKDIAIHTLCEHHLLPFAGKMHIGYVPNNTVIGLSKLPRVVESLARRLQIQERLTRQVTHTINEILRPQGVAVIMEAHHMCMAMRGIKSTSTTTITSCMVGCFEQPGVRSEFQSLIGMKQTG